VTLDAEPIKEPESGTRKRERKVRKRFSAEAVDVNDLVKESETPEIPKDKDVKFRHSLELTVEERLAAERLSDDFLWVPRPKVSANEAPEGGAGEVVKETSKKRQSMRRRSSGFKVVTNRVEQLEAEVTNFCHSLLDKSRELRYMIIIIKVGICV